MLWRLSRVPSKLKRRLNILTKRRYTESDRPARILKASIRLNMKTVYLDQNKWIDLARAFHGKDSEPRLNRALDFVRDASRQGSISVPLSAVHYMETAKIGNRARRARLGVVMWELSCGYTLASYNDVSCHEL